MEDAKDYKAELIEAAAGGDRQAWTKIVQEHASLVWSVGRGCGLSREDSEDVAQTVFAALVRRLPHLRDRAALSGWLVVAAKRESWRISARNRRLRNDGGESAAHVESEPAELDTLERQQAVRASLARLDSRCQDLLTELFGIGDTPSYEVIAKRLGLRPNSVGPTRRRCLDQLLEDLQETAQDLF